MISKIVSVPLNLWNKLAVVPNEKIFTVKRDLTVDLAKLIAMLSVIALHTCYYSRTDVFLVYLASVLGVPMFFTVSGYLLLNRKEAGWKYSFNKIGGIIKYIVLSILFIHVLFYSAWALKNLIVGSPVPFTLLEAIKDIAFDISYAVVPKGRFFVYWFLGALMLIYLLYPLVHKLFTYRKVYLSVLFCLFIIEVGVLFLNLNDDFEHSVPEALQFWNWLFYFMLGGVFRIFDFKNIRWQWILGTAIFSLCAYILTYMVCSKFGILKVPYRGSWYCCPFVMLYVASVFILVKRLNLNTIGLVAAGISSLSSVFLPVYSYHMIIARSIPLNLGAGIPLFISTSIISIIFGLILTKLPYVKSIFKI